MDDSYWQRQTVEAPLFPNIEWNKPEQRRQAGQLGIVGGNKLGFAGVAESYSVALAAGCGAVRVILPDVLKKTIPPTMTDVIFGTTNPSGGLAKGSEATLEALTQWADGLLLIGDAGRNSETAILYEQFFMTYEGPLTITRDAVDLMRHSTQTLIERPDTSLIVSFAQLQKLFQAVYYPKVLTFSMQLTNLVEAVHKFTTTYPCIITVLHKDTLIVSYQGQVTTTPWENPMMIWRGTMAAKAASYWLWNRSKPLESITASLLAH